MIDTNSVLKAYLKTSGTGLYTLVGARIHMTRVPAGFANTATALEVMRNGGDDDAYVAMHDPTYQIKCFGGTTSHANAQAVYRALCDRLHRASNVTVTGGVIMRADQEILGQDLHDPDTGWPFVLTTFRVTMRPAS